MNFKLHKSRHLANEPFPNIVIEGAFPPEPLNEVLEEWPSTDQLHHHSNDHEEKWFTNDREVLGKRTNELIDLMNADEVVKELSELSGIKDLSSDTTLKGGGLHEIRRGGFLKPHVDFNKHPSGLYRRLNILIFLNKGMTPDDGGDLILYGKDKKAAKAICPAFNITAIFSLSDTSWHGHPHPLKAEVRRSIALYYYAPEPAPGMDKDKHGTIFM